MTLIRAFLFNLQILIAAFTRVLSVVLLFLTAAGLVVAPSVEGTLAESLFMIACALLAAVAAVGLLVPASHRFLTRSDSVGHARTARLIFHFAVPLGMALVFFDLVEEPRSPTKGLIPDWLVVVALLVFAGLYTASYLYPGFAARIGDMPAGQRPPGYHWTTHYASDRARLRHRLALALLLPIPTLGAGPPQYFSWLPAPGFAQWAGHLWPVEVLAVVALVAFGFAGVTSRLMNPATGAVLRTSPGRRALRALVLAGLAVAFVGPAVQSGLPWLLSFLPTGHVERAEVLVTDPGAFSRMRGCDRTVLVARPGQPARISRLCSLDEAVWRGLQAGDRLTVTGIVTSLGMRVTEVRRAE